MANIIVSVIRELFISGFFLINFLFYPARVIKIPIATAIATLMPCG